MVVGGCLPLPLPLRCARRGRAPWGPQRRDADVGWRGGVLARHDVSGDIPDGRAVAAGCRGVGAGSASHGFPRRDIHIHIRILPPYLHRYVWVCLSDRHPSLWNPNPSPYPSCSFLFVERYNRARNRSLLLRFRGRCMGLLVFVALPLARIRLDLSSALCSDLGSGPGLQNLSFPFPLCVFSCSL